ncbi:MAG: hypothetical protein WBW33_18825, partial [Bryobacteraceae bacterium]
MAGFQVTTIGRIWVTAEAIEFYESLGATYVSGWLKMKLTGDAFKAIAAQSNTSFVDRDLIEDKSG